MSRYIAEKPELTWRDVFDTSHRNWGHIANAADGASIAGYRYYAWNGRVYNTDLGNDTGVLVEEVK